VIKIALFMWLVAFVLMLFGGANERRWMVRLAYGGFCLLLLAMLIKVIRI
jgi:hypothetical protein